MRSYLYPVLLGLSALSISLSSAYYSVYGLGALFAGAAIQIMVMAGTLEFAKVVLSGFLHRYWKDLPALLKGYLSVAVVVLVIISSMGIYGYLAAAYQSSSLELGSVQERIEVLDARKDRYAQQISSINQERVALSSTILSLSQGLSGNTVQYVDPRTGQVLTTQSSASRSAIQQQLNSARNREAALNVQAEALSDSLIVLDDRVFEIKEASQASRNLGPLIFLSEVTGMPMDRVVNVLIVIIMLVFDPLAITMIIATSVAFDTVRKPVKPEEEEYIDEVVQDPEQQVSDNPEPKPTSGSFSKYFEPLVEQLDSPKKLRKVSRIKKVGNFYHIVYEDSSVDRIHEDVYYKFVNDLNLNLDSVKPAQP